MIIIENSVVIFSLSFSEQFVFGADPINDVYLGLNANREHEFVSWRTAEQFLPGGAILLAVLPISEQLEEILDEEALTELKTVLGDEAAADLHQRLQNTSKRWGEGSRVDYIHSREFNELVSDQLPTVAADAKGPLIGPLPEWEDELKERELTTNLLVG